MNKDRTRKSWLETLFARGVLACMVLLLAGLPSSGSAGTYYLLGADPSDTSSLSGYGSCVGWGTAPGGSKVATAVEPGNVYVIPSGKTARTPSSGKDGSGKSYTFPGDQLVFEGGTVNLKHGGVQVGSRSYDFEVTNLLARGSSTTSQISCGNWGVTYNLKGANWVIDPGATFGLCITSDNADPRTFNVQAAIRGAGTLRLFTNTGSRIGSTCGFILNGDFSGFTGDIDIDGCYATVITVADPDSFGSEPASGTNLVAIDGFIVSDRGGKERPEGVQLKFNCDYTAGPNRRWAFGSNGGTTSPILSVDNGKTVTILGPIGGSVDLKKEGGGTLVFAHPNLAHYNGPTNFTGGATISADELAVMANMIDHWAPFAATDCNWDGSMLTLTLVRGVTLAQDLYVAYGENDGGDVPDNWDFYGPFSSSFPAGVTNLDVAVPLPEGMKFVRFYNGIDGWSNTIDMDEIGIVTDSHPKLSTLLVSEPGHVDAEASVTLSKLGYGASGVDVFAVYSHDGFVYTNQIAESATQTVPIPFTLANLKPGTAYGIYLFATNGLADGVCRLPEEGMVEFSTLPEGGGDRRLPAETGVWKSRTDGWGVTVPSENNLIRGKLPSRYENRYSNGVSDSESAATDGLFPDTQPSDYFYFGAGNGCVASWTFDTPSTITSVRFYTPQGARSRVNIQSVTATVDGNEVTISPGYILSENSRSYVYTHLDAAEGHSLANLATAVTVYFADNQQDGGVYYSEIETIGFDSGFLQKLSTTDASWDGTILSTTLLREGGEESSVYACFGVAYGNDETNAWEHCEQVGLFANDASSTVVVATVPDGTRYVRFFSERDGWSESFYLPELPRKRSPWPDLLMEVSNLGPTYARLAATVSSTGTGSSELSLESALGTNPDSLPEPVPFADALSLGASVSTNLIGLLPNTTYYWRLTVDNGTEGGTTNFVTSFTTKSIPGFDDPASAKAPIITLDQPVFTEPGILSISYEVLWPGAGAALCDVALEYGDSAALLNHRVDVARDVIGPQKATLTGFLPGHTYSVRLAATNAFGAATVSTPVYRVACPPLTEKFGKGRAIEILEPLDGASFEASLVVAEGESGGQTLLAFWGTRFGAENPRSWAGSAVVAENLPAGVCTNGWTATLPADAEFVRFAVRDESTGLVSWSETYVRSVDGTPLIGYVDAFVENGDTMRMVWDFHSVGAPDDRAVFRVHYGTDEAASEVTRNYGTAEPGVGEDTFPNLLPETTYYWYLELVTPRGYVARSPVRTFTTPGPSRIKIEENPDNRLGRVIDFPFLCTELGVGTTEAILMVGPSSGKDLMDPSKQTLFELDRMTITATNSYSFTWDGRTSISKNGHAFAPLAYGDLVSWQIVLSNESEQSGYRSSCYACGTFRVSDPRTFTWSGADGAPWDDPDSWTPSDDEPSDAPGYPIWGSTALFSDDAAVSIPEALTVQKIELANETELTLQGPGSLFVNGAPWQDNTAKWTLPKRDEDTGFTNGGQIPRPSWVPNPLVQFGTGSSLHLADGAFLFEDSPKTERILTSGQKFFVENGSSYGSPKKLFIKGGSSELVIDGGSVVFSGEVHPSDSNDASGGITIGGATGSLFVSNKVFVANASYAPGKIAFSVPADGYLNIPLRTQISNGNKFADGAGLIELSVPTHAPAALINGEGDFLLIEWSYVGIATNRIVLAELPHPDTDYWFWTYDNSSATNGETVTGLGVHLLGGIDEPTAPSIRKLRLTNCSETTADFEATVAPGGTSPTADFLFALTAKGSPEPAEGAWTPIASAVADRTVLSIPLTQLTRETDYTVWLRGVNAAGTTIVPFDFSTLGDFAVLKSWTGATAERTYGPYTILTFSDPSKLATLEVSRGGQAEILLVGGGGAGGKAKGYHGGAGGGGAGGFVHIDETSLLPGSYTIQVGAGGEVTTDAHVRSNGEPSRLLDASGYVLFTALGGGGGGSGFAPAGRDGGSGGGGVGSSDSEVPGPGGHAEPGQGHGGGTNQVDPTESDAGGSGGGGAGEAGWNADGANAGDGGAGLPCSISGNTLYYAGGGAGGPRDGSTAKGGLGGGADSRKREFDGAAGADGFGGGGAGGAGSMNGAAKNGGRGGCGTVIIRARTAPQGVFPYVAFRAIEPNATDAEVEFEILELGEGADGVDLSFVWGETEDDLRYTIPMGRYDTAKVGLHTVTGLRPNHRYYAKLVADNGLAGGIGETTVFAFTTGPIEESGDDGRIIPGLWQAVISKDKIDKETNIRLREIGPGESQRRAELSPVAGTSVFEQNAYLPSTSYPDNPVKMTTKTTYAYVGFVYLPAGTTYFMLNSEEASSLSISGIGLSAPVSISNSGSNPEFGTATVTAAGWFAIDIRLYNGSGPGCAIENGFVDASGKPVTVGYTANATTYAFSMAKLTDMITDRWINLADSGDGSILRTDLPKRSVWVESTEVSASGLIGTVAFGNEAGGSSALYMAYGPEWCGADQQAWAASGKFLPLSTIEASTTSSSFGPVPNWGTTNFYVRFCLRSGSAGDSWSDPIFYEDPAAPSISDFSLANVLGDTFTVVGKLGTCGTGCDTAQVFVEYGHSDDFSDAVRWEIGEHAVGSFRETVFTNDVASEYYVVPGDTYYVRLVAVNDAGIWTSSDIRSFATAAGSKLSVDSPIVVQRNATLIGRLSEVGCGETAVRFRWSTDGGATWQTRDLEPVPAGTHPRNTEFSPMRITTDNFGDAILWEFSCSNGCATASWTDKVSGSFTSKDATVYKWKPVGGIWDGDWTDTTHWTPDNTDNIGYPNNPDATADFSDCPVGLSVAVSVTNRVNGGTIRSTTSGQELTFLGDEGSELAVRWDLAGMGSSYAIEDLHFNASQTSSLTLKQSVSILVGPGAVLSMGPVKTCLGAGTNRIEVLEGASLNINGSFTLQGTGSEVLLENATATVTGTIEGPSNVDSHFLFRGENAKLRVKGSITHHTMFLFDIPKNGYESAPIEKIGTAQFDSNNQRGNRFVVLPGSEIFDSGKYRSIPLMRWKGVHAGGAPEDHFILDETPFAANGVNRLHVYYDDDPATFEGRDFYGISLTYKGNGGTSLLIR